jgi:hypothetical protein
MRRKKWLINEDGILIKRKIELGFICAVSYNISLYDCFDSPITKVGITFMFKKFTK